MLQQITDGVDVGVSQHMTLILGLGSCRVGQPASFLLSSPPDELSSIALASVFTPCSHGQGVGPVQLLHPQGPFFHTSAYRVSSTVVSRQGVGPAQVLQLVGEQGQFSCSYDLRASSPTCLRC